MICTVCGQPLPEGAYFCQKCGTEAKPAVLASSPAAPAGGSGPVTPPQTSGMAIASLICGLLFFLVFPAVLAVIFGHVALSKIKHSAGRLTGRGLAIAGLVLGYLEIVAFIPIILIIAAIAIPNLLRARMAANEASAASSVRTINFAEVSYYSMFGAYAPNLASLGGADPCSPRRGSACLIDDKLATATAGTGKTGYLFFVEGSGDGSQYLVKAWPVTPNTTGTRSFCSTEDAVVRVNSSGGMIEGREACLALPAI